VFNAYRQPFASQAAIFLAVNLFGVAATFLVSVALDRCVRPSLGVYRVSTLSGASGPAFWVPAGDQLLRNIVWHFQNGSKEVMDLKAMYRIDFDEDIVRVRPASGSILYRRVFEQWIHPMNGLDLGRGFLRIHQRPHVRSAASL